MAAVDLLTRDDLAEVLAELRRVRAAIDALQAERQNAPLTLDEAARHLGVGRRTVQRWVKEGRLQAVRVGHTTRVRLDGAAPAR